MAVELLHLMEHFDQRIRPAAAAPHDLGDALAVIDGGWPRGGGGP